jgi:hypothetical protein
MSNPEDDAFKQRIAGRAATGTVGIRNFDEGVVVSLGAYIADDAQGMPKYWLKTDSGAFGDTTCPPPGDPGVPVVFGNPEDVLQNVQYPMVLVQRLDASPAMERWQSEGAQQYRAPSRGAVPFIANLSNGTSVNGFDRMEVLAQAWPYDIMYQISVRARYRGAPGQRNQVNALFGHIMRKFPPYGKINVVDSVGDLRGYEAFNESVSNIDVVADVQDRTMGMQITIRVEGELDLKDPQTVQTVRRVPVLSTKLM